MSLITPAVLKGFRDFLPEYEIERKRVSRLLADNFESYGYVPIDTPILEYTEVLLGKGGGETDKQVYRFNDHGNRDVSMRFDLTVPFARFMAAHVNELYLPFRRYHIEKVWRGENTQKGRYREFTQCDFDIVGIDSASADFEILLMMKGALQQIGIQDFKIKISHRGIFNSFLSKEGIQDKSVEILRIVDKVHKIGPDETLKLLESLVNSNTSQKILTFITAEPDYLSTLKKLEKLAGSCEGLTRMTELHQLILDLDLGERICFDPSITRGLDYYTGLVYETFLDKLPGIGSVCSGGRYNNLAGLYTKQLLPGVGASIGLDRLFAAMDELNLMNTASSTSHVLLMNMDSQFLAYYHKIAEKLRASGIAVEVYPETKKLKQQFALAEKKGITFGLFIGEDEIQAETYTLKNLLTRENYDKLSFNDLVKKLNS